MNLRKRKGFTLIELIVVMAIIAILVLLAAPKYLNYTKDAHVTAMQQDAKVLQNIALGYNVKHDGEYPVLEEAVEATEIEDQLTALFGEVPTLKAFDEEKVSGSIQGLKNELEDYALITEGENQGEVIYLNGPLQNSDGLQFISISPQPEETPDETPEG